MRVIVMLLFVFSTLAIAAQPSQRNGERIKIDTATLSLKNFADSISGSGDDFTRARKLLYWLSSNFDWLATDYQVRTVNEIMNRGGGNCFELAKVYVAMIKEAGIKYRSTQEINIHPVTPRRQVSAADLVKQRGNRYSVFGLQHNDHRWVEIYNARNNTWEPADPSMGVIGLNDWLKARVWFGERKTIDTAITNEMIVPFAIFVTDGKGQPGESRSKYYLVDKFDELYDHKLSGLPEWKDWTTAVNKLTDPAKNAFLGEENLHLHQDAIRRLADIYQSLKKAYLANN
ncbi:MAG: transglutaminase domain-containing protein [Chitinophagaceae bacterium]|nr:transglutaminase domain-containing protein [Chitinophagaceae bacterium]